ncbi:hypothetical protein GCM10010345_83740 [Streptomyces canarius]|uniref:Uncharacterized protein n=1 Tax=Streptomyces canarius TaxID=285453 RepID=A0ABQ3DFA5_9ACTN|nr:hypothetical protein GCM10010345_83740 [Streptomyces canarius]
MRRDGLAVSWPLVTRTSRGRFGDPAGSQGGDDVPPGRYGRIASVGGGAEARAAPSWGWCATTPPLGRQHCSAARAHSCERLGRPVLAMRLATCFSTVRGDM